MNTNDLPPAAKLAALIEAGRAANPDVRHGRKYVQARHEDGHKYACALGFGALGTGRRFGEVIWTLDAMHVCGISPKLAFAVACANDRGVSLDDICLDLREGEMAKMKITA